MPDKAPPVPHEPAQADHRTQVMHRCACGGLAPAGGECEACRRTREQREAARPRAPLTIGPTSDALERAADRMAADVDGPVGTAPRPGVLQARTAGALATRPPPAVERYVGSLDRRAGAALAPTVRDALEPRFGRDFSAVRVHTDTDAAASARGVRALAYTVGRHIVFGAGQFTPDSEAGRRLLAHELTHVVQQSGGDGPPTLQRARWGTCPTGKRLPVRAHPFRYGAAEAGMVAYYKAQRPGNCVATNLDLFNEIRCAGQPGRMVRQFTEHYLSGKNPQQRRRVEPAGKVRTPGAGKNPTEKFEGYATEAVFAYLRPDIIDFTKREIYDVTTAHMAGRKRSTIKGYVKLAKAITRREWTGGETLPAPGIFRLHFRYRPGETICYGPTDLQRNAGVLAYEVIEEKKKKSDKKKKKKKPAKKKQPETKKPGTKKKPSTKKPKTPKTPKPPKTPKAPKPGASAGAANLGFGIGIGSTGVGAGNVGVSISIMSSGASFGTVSAGIVYDSNGVAVGTVGVSAASGSTSVTAGAAGATAAKDSESAAAAAVAAGKAEGSTAAGAGVAASGSSKDDVVAGAGVKGSGESEGAVGAAAGVSGKPGKAGETGAEGKGKEGEPGKHGLGIPGLTPDQADKAVEEAAKIQELVAKATPEQQALMAHLAQITGDPEYVVPADEWARRILDATDKVKAEDIAYLITLEWRPGHVTPAELKRQVADAIKRRKTGEAPGLPAETLVKPPKVPKVAKPPKPAKEAKGIAGAPEPASGKTESDQARIDRLAKRAKDYDWGKVGYGIVNREDTTEPQWMKLYVKETVDGELRHLTADIYGTAVDQGNKTIISVSASSELVAPDGWHLPAGLLDGDTLTTETP